MPLSAAILETLHSIVGDKGFTTDKTEISPFLTESRGRFHGVCDVLLKPENANEVSQILTICNDENIPVVPQGGNTGHCGGAVPDGGVLLNLSRLNKIRHLDPLNATITVEAGCILADIQEAADDAGLMFPLSLAAEGSCQIGGNLATNAGGIHVLRYGNTRELTLGMEAVLPTGELWNGLRGLRKDNTGYDLKHLFIGAEGTLGVITATVLKLFPQPKEIETAFIGAASPLHLIETFNRLRDHFGEDLSAFEILPRFGLEIVRKHFDNAQDPFTRPHDWYGVIELSSPRKGAGLKSALQEILHGLFDDQYVQDAIVAESLTQAKALWALRENMSEAQKHEGGSIKHDVSVPVSKIAEFITETSHMLNNILPGIRLCTFGHLGDGNIHFNISQPVDMDKQAFLGHWEEFNDVVHQMAEKFNGSFSAEHGIGLLKIKEMETYRGGPELDMMRAIKHALDPNGIMNPGKIVP